MRETQAPLSTMARTNLKQGSGVTVKKSHTLGRRLNINREVQWWLPITCEGGKAACLDVYSAVSVGLILVRWTGLHLGETFIGCDGVNLYPALPGLLLSGGRLQKGESRVDTWQWAKREIARRKSVENINMGKMINLEITVWCMNWEWEIHSTINQRK